MSGDANVSSPTQPTQADAVGWILFKNPLGVESEGSDEVCVVVACVESHGEDMAITSLLVCTGCRAQWW